MEKKIEEKGGKKEEEVGDFFFQAEDGIRDRDVTGVQTCALPIFCNTCHGEYSAYVKEIVNGKECPFCSEKYPLPGFNTLAQIGRASCRERV